MLQFDLQGKLKTDYTRILGAFGSETAHQYLYRDGKIDSLNTKASVKNVSTKSKYYYNRAGLLDSISCKGFYVDYTDRFTHDNNNRIIRLERVYKKGNPGFDENYHSNGQLEYSKIERIGKSNLLNFFNRNSKFISFEKGRDTLTVNINNKEKIKVYIGKMSIEKAIEMR